MTYTTRIASPEMQRLQTLWARPVIAMGAVRSPLVRATREAMERTKTRIGTVAGLNGLDVEVYAHQIKNGLPVGVAKSHTIATGCSAQQAIDFLNAYTGEEA